MMKYFAGLLAICVAILGVKSACDYNNGNGRPACNAKEFPRLWRNNWDPTRYWKCEGLNRPPVEVHCEEDTGFLQAKQCCVPWQQWSWTAPCDPPSVQDVKEKV